MPPDDTQYEAGDEPEGTRSAKIVEAPAQVLDLSAQSESIQRPSLGFPSDNTRMEVVFPLHDFILQNHKALVEVKGVTRVIKKSVKNLYRVKDLSFCSNSA